jgi:beta-lactamase superfamily II metal-dependent hydrolase
MQSKSTNEGFGVGIEIDFLAVGEQSKSGDAIAIRYGNLHGRRDEQSVVVIDGGYTDSGTALVELIQTHYGTDFVDLVISTHPDQDHVCGLETVIQRLRVGQLWMHLPWKHSAELNAARRHGISRAGLPSRVEASLQGAADLEEIANTLGIPIIEPFAGLQSADGAITIIGPTQWYYEQLMTEIQTSGQGGLSLGSLLAKAAQSLANLVPETLHIETLSDNGSTHPQNNTSVLTLLDFDNERHLFTGDAGIPALEHGLDLLESQGFVSGSLDFVQIPHHGSRRNVGPTVLDRLLGPKGQAVHARAIVSAAKLGSPKHPAKKVTNAFHRRGYEVAATQGVTILHGKGAPPRAGYGPLAPLPFYALVEEDEG